MKRKFICFLIVIVMVCSACNEYEKDDIEQYKNCLEQDGLSSGMTLFPDEIKDESCVKNFYFHRYEGLLDDEDELYLECVYDKETYELEVERLSSEENAYYEDTGGKAIYDEENFKYPAYVINLGYGNTSEYALCIEENYKIVYVYLRYMDEKKIKMSKEYLPVNYEGDGNCKNGYMAEKDGKYYSN